MVDKLYRALGQWNGDRHCIGYGDDYGGEKSYLRCCSEGYGTVTTEQGTSRQVGPSTNSALLVPRRLRLQIVGLLLLNPVLVL